MKLQAPTPKPQRKTKHQASSLVFRVWVLGFGYSLVIGFCFLGFPCAIMAQAPLKETLEVNFKSSTLRARSDAPAMGEVSFKWTGLRVLEGRVEMRFMDGRELLAIYTSPDIALTTGDQTFRWQLPAVHPRGYTSQVDVKMSFITAKKRFDFPDTWQLSMAGAQDRITIIGQCLTVTNANEMDGKLLQSLRYDRFDPRAGQQSGRTVPTCYLAPRVPPDDMPLSPIGYCAYDVMACVGEGFNELKEKPLVALKQWTLAGGSLFVVPRGVLKEYHVKFLNDLAGRDLTDPAFRLDGEGHLQYVAETNPPPAVKFHSELGRLVVVLRLPKEDERFTAFLNSANWLQLVGHLWKFRASQLANLATTARWVGLDELKQKVKGKVEIPKPKANIGYVPPAQPQQIQKLSNDILATLQAEGQTVTREQSDQVAKDLLQEAGFSIQPTSQQRYNQYGQPERTDLVSQLGTTLLPKNVRLIPLSVIVLILVLFVLAVGPADYFLLGLIKQRRLTWVIFPIVSIGFTLFTVYLSSQYLGRRDHRNSLVIVDVARDGRPLRESRYELIFVAKEKPIITKVENALFSPLEHQQVQTDPYQRGQSQIVNLSEGRSDVITYDGRIPTQYQTHQFIGQWSWQLNRMFTFDSKTDTSKVNWGGAESGSGYGGQIRIISGGELMPSVILHAICSSDPILSNSPLSRLSPTGGGHLDDLPLLDSTDGNQALIVVIAREGNEIRVFRRLLYGQSTGIAARSATDSPIGTAIVE